MSFDLRTLLRGHAPIKLADALRGGAGALLGIAAVGFLARLVHDHAASWVPLIAAPIGASAVLVFAVPASPLAQPRGVIGGNLIGALVGVACGLLIPVPLLAAAVAVGAAIVVMSLLGCLHPPGGAVALGAALAAPAAGPAALPDTVGLVGLCSLLLVAAAMLYAKVSGRSYPHRVAPPANVHATTDRPPSERVGFTPADLDRALAQYGELLDIGRDDLDALFRQVELQAHRRIHSRIRCGDVMSTDVKAVAADQSAETALAFLRAHDLRTAPVIDGLGRVVGMVRRAELVAGLGRPVGALLDPLVRRVQPSTAIEALLPILSSGAAHEAMVVDEAQRLVGVITQTDLLAVLYRAHVVESVASAA